MLWKGALLSIIIGAGGSGAEHPAVAAANHGTTCGTASYYGTESGSRTANGEPFDGSSMTAAMPSRSHLGERYRVTFVGTAKHPGTGRSVIVRINDYGPAAYLHRIMDLSRAAAEVVGIKQPGRRGGLGRVCIERLAQ